MDADIVMAGSSLFWFGMLSPRETVSYPHLITPGWCRPLEKATTDDEGI